MGPILDRLWRERRVARTWHRYLLPHQVDTVRARWLANLEKRRDGPAAVAGYAEGQAILSAWNGWNAGAGGA